MPRVIIPIPCHFKERTELCATTVARMHVSLSELKNDDTLLLTGDVPYALGSPTLGFLMHNWFMQHGIAPQVMRELKGVYGTFSEARGACTMIKEFGIQQLVLISSPWYFFAGTPVWQRRAKENGITLSCIAVPHTGGFRTWFMYGFIGIIIRTALATGTEKQLESLVTGTQKKRTEGFTLNGCA